jgi:23S rRNA (cytidine2498-2'-O)-methyltransferase
LQIPAGGSALDLGAAPGGFTEVLLNSGLNVTAVDPAELDARVAGREGLTHFRGLAQHFSPSESFDVITNDMRLDITDSVCIMNDMYKYLRSDGFGVVVLKLSDGHWKKKTDRAVGLLSKAYGYVRAKQLHSNRSEVTVVVRL